jgi:ascorbate-specific PTS system EIIC-type component UlaA
MILLSVQFWLGMGNNLFTILPTPPPLFTFSAAPLVFTNYQGGIEVLAHICFGFAVLILGVVIPPSLKQAGDHRGALLSWLAFASVASALFGGMMFAFAGQNNSFSMEMAMSFISALLVYFVALYMFDREKKTPITTS